MRRALHLLSKDETSPGREETLNALHASLEAVSDREPQYQNVLHRVKELIMKESFKKLKKFQTVEEQVEEHHIYDRILLIDKDQEKDRLSSLDYLTIQSTLSDLEELPLWSSKNLWYAHTLKRKLGWHHRHSVDELIKYHLSMGMDSNDNIDLF